VDDGSTDGTPARIRAHLEAAGLPNLELLAYRPRRGKGHAVRVGIEHARAPLVCFTDGDLPYSLDHLRELVAALGAHDLVIGCRRGGDPTERTIGRPRWVMGRCFNRLARLALGLPHPDTQAGLKGFRRDAARALFARQRVRGFGFDVEVLYLARRLGYRVGEIPVRVSSDHSYAGSQVDLVRDPVRMCRDLVTIRWRGARGGYHFGATPAARSAPRVARGPVPRSGVGSSNHVCLTLDVEEFDVPLEYGRWIPADEQDGVSAAGLRAVLELLDELAIPATLFCTALFAERHPELIRRAAAAHEIASHGVRHAGLAPGDPRRSRERLERVLGAPVRGFRAPRMAAVAAAELVAAGYAYDASGHPTWLPGRYNRLGALRRAARRDGLYSVPASVTPLLRLPLFWLSFKNLPGWLIRLASAWTLRADGYLVLYFHPWEFADLSAYPLPRYVRRVHGPRLVRRLARYLRWLSARATFVTLAEFERTRRPRA
jgi:peptidoglycan/xylan/chitin deacetylase (PgdA/CDA1 family)